MSAGNMQNLDYSRRIRKATPLSPQREELGADLPLKEVAEQDVRSKNRYLVYAAAVALLTFTLGIMAGMQLAKLKQIDESVIKYPDGGDRQRSSTVPRQSTDTTSMAEKGAGSPGRFIIKIGTFSAQESERITNRINDVPEIARAKTTACRNVNETVPERFPSFRTRLADTAERQNVFVGCFDDAESARTVLQILRKESFDQAKLFEIE